MAAVLPPKRGSSFPCLHLPNQTLLLKTFDAVASKRTAEPNNSKHQKVKTSRVLEQKVDKCGLTYMIIHGLTKISQVVFFGLYDFTTLRRAAELQYSCNIAPNCVRGSREAAGKHLSARL